MKTNMQAYCEQFIINRDQVKETLKYGSLYMYPVCANLYLSRQMPVDEAKLKNCQEWVKEKTGVFSNFRGMIQLPLFCMLSMEENPEEKLDRVLAVYEDLKTEFYSSTYLPLTAYYLSEQENILDNIARGKAIYQRMKKEHPFLTSSEDSVFAVLLACSGKDEDVLMHDMEECYRLLKEKFSAGNHIQTVSHILSLADGAAFEKVDRLIQLYDALQQSGRKYGKYHELAVLASLSVMNGNIQDMVGDMLDADAFLSTQKGYGFWGLDKKSRLMHAAMIISNAYAGDGHMNPSAVTAALSIVIAQQMAAISAAAAASTAAASASN